MHLINIIYIILCIDFDGVFDRPSFLHEYTSTTCSYFYKTSIFYYPPPGNYHSSTDISNVCNYVSQPYFRLLICLRTLKSVFRWYVCVYNDLFVMCTRNAYNYNWLKGPSTLVHDIRDIAGHARIPLYWTKHSVRVLERFYPRTTKSDTK